MSELGDDFREWQQAKKAKRSSNTEQSTSILTRAGIVFESKNGGVHLIVFAASKIVDFWPITGLWIVRDGKVQKRRGVRKLVEFVEQQHIIARSKS